MNKYGKFLKLEAFANVSSKMLPAFKEEIARIRKAGDYSQEAMEKSKLSEIIFSHHGLKINFIVSDKIGMNAFYRVPSMDSNHPFYTTRGFSDWFGADSGKALLKEGVPLKGGVDLKNWAVTGIYSEIEQNIVIGLDLIKSSDFSNDEVAEILAHEVGHSFDYFRLLGDIIHDSSIISAASKIAAGKDSVEVKEKVLVQAKEQLGIEELNYKDLLQTADLTRKDAVELVLVSNSLIKGSNQSPAKSYNVRSIEQAADAFVAYNGGGRALASALVKLHRSQLHRSTLPAAVYILVEVIKVYITAIMLAGAPVTAILWLLAMTPSAKIYDSPEERLNVLKQQCVAALRQVKCPVEKASLMEEIEAIDSSMKLLKDRRSVYELIFDTITPVGRKRYQQEKHQQQIKDLLFNELQAKTLKWSKQNG